MTKNFKLILSYLGTSYNGMQIQKNGITIQELLQDALFKIFKSRIKIKYSSRTDSGVHAYQQVVSFKVETNISPDNLLKGLNSILPYDIAVLDILAVDDNFNAGFSKQKTYQYIIYNSKIRDPLRMDRAWWIPYYLDVQKMIDASKLLLGVHDFKSFMGAGSLVKTTVREVYAINIDIINKDIVINISANGFLKQMVRNIVGTLVEIGRARIEPNDIINIIAQCNRTKAGKTAPACGLYLIKVEY